MRSSLQEPREPAILEHLATGLLLGAVAHDVVLVVDGLNRRAAPRARLAGLAVDLERQRQLVGNRQLDDALVVLERGVERRDDRLAEHRGLLLVEVVAPLERRELR